MGVAVKRLSRLGRILKLLKSGSFIFVAGQGRVDPATRRFVEGDVACDLSEEQIGQQTKPGSTSTATHFSRYLIPCAENSPAKKLLYLVKSNLFATKG